MIPRLQNEYELESFYPDADAASEQELMQIVGGQPPAAAPAPMDWQPLAQQISQQWQGYGINPEIKGINRANELAQILSNYGISDLSKIGVKQTPYEEMRGQNIGGDAGEYIEELYKGNRGQLTYGDQTFGRLGGFGSSGGQEFAAPQEYLTEAGDGRYNLAYSAAGKGWTDYDVAFDSAGKPVIIPKWGSSSDITPELVQFLAIAAMPFTGGLSSTLAGAGLGTVGGKIASQALVSGLLGGLGAEAQGGSFGSGFGKGALQGGITGGLTSVVNPAISKAVSSAVPEFGIPKLDDILPSGVSNIATEALKSAVLDKPFDLRNALAPTAGEFLQTEYGLNPKTAGAMVNVGSKLLSGQDLTPSDLLKFADFTPTKASPAAPKPAPVTVDSPEATPSVPSSIEDLLRSVSEPEFGTQEAIDARTQELINEILNTTEAEPAAGELPSWALDPYADEPVAQSYPVTAQSEATLPDIFTPAPEPAPRPLTPIEEFKFQEANMMPEAPDTQQVEVTGERIPAMPEDFRYTEPPMTEAELQQLVAPAPTAPAPDTQRVEVTAKKAEPLPVEFYETELEPEVLGGMPMDDTQRYTATGKLPEQTFYELPEAPVMQEEQRYFKATEGETPKIDVTGKLGTPEVLFYELPEAPVMQDPYQPPGALEGPSKIEVTGKREPVYEQPPTPALDEPRYFTATEGKPETIEITGKKYEPIYEQPPTPEPEPIYEQPPTPEPEPIYEQPPTPAPSPAPTPPTARPPSPAPAPAAQSQPDLSGLLSLLGAGSGQTTYAPVLFQGPKFDIASMLADYTPEDLMKLLRG
jgi:hypothetical protein